MNTVLERLDVTELFAGKPLAQASDDALRHVHTDVRHNESCLKLLEHVLVDLAARHEVCEVVG